MSRDEYEKHWDAVIADNYGNPRNINATSSKCTECGAEYPDGHFNIRQHRDIEGPILCRACESKRVHGNTSHTQFPSLNCRGCKP